MLNNSERWVFEGFLPGSWNEIIGGNVKINPITFSSHPFEKAVQAKNIHMEIKVELEVQPSLIPIQILSKKQKLYE